MRLLVAPRAGAWIETHFHRLHCTEFWSHPVRVRGLKPGARRACRKAGQSHPVRVRGLKHMSGLPMRELMVAPRAGAWIETQIGHLCY